MSASARDIRGAYLDQMVLGYVVYAVGAVTALIAVQLSLSKGQAGLHSSALAVGMTGAAALADRIDVRLGFKRAHRLALLILAAGTALVAWAPAWAVSLLGALGLGLGYGMVLAHVNAVLSDGGGWQARVQLVRGTFISMVASLTVPLVIGAAAVTGARWSVVALPALVAIGLALGAPRVWTLSDGAQGNAMRGHLPRTYWLAWLLVVGCIAIEFAILYWSGTMLARTTGTSVDDATPMISVFVGGMIASRGALSVEAVGRLGPYVLLRSGLAVATLGAFLPWFVPSHAGGLVAMSLLGIGVGALYPVGASLAMASAPLRPRAAATRLVMASGVAILLAPAVFGFAADVVGIATAWAIIPALCIASLALSWSLSGRR